MNPARTPYKAGLAALAVILLGTSSPLFAHVRPHFPPGAPWTRDISGLSADPASSAMISASVGWGTSAPDRFQIDFAMSVLNTAGNVVDHVPLVQNSGYYLPDCDLISLVPIPRGGAIEGSDDYSCDYGDSDCHLLVVDGSHLYESYQSSVDVAGLHSTCLVRWNLNRVYPPSGRGEQCTSADAAGFPIAPLLFNADEVAAAIANHGDLGHAIRFILPNARMRDHAYVHPASHAGNPHGPADAIPYGARLRLKGNFDISGFNPAAQVVLRTLKKYGMFLSDGGNIPLTAESDRFTTAKWDDLDFDSHSLFGVRLTDFQVMPIGTVIPSTQDCHRNPDELVYNDGFDNLLGMLPLRNLTPMY